ncbi:MAG: hypothetical protein JO138_13085 [Acidobacteriaceae bacterium]|nr:hypothetical protein [Acidobacteriaceae bacterium]
MPLRSLGLFCCALVLSATPQVSEQPTAADISGELAHVTLDPQQAYYVRNLQLARGDIKLYITEGVFAFARAVEGHRLAAIFTTAFSDAGDAELLLLPPDRSERASLAAFAKTPNLDEHFRSAVFLFSDATEKELLSQIDAEAVRPASDVATRLAQAADPIFQSSATGLETRLVQSVLDAHTPEQGFFFAAIAGSRLGPFDVMYEPDRFEPVTVGTVVSNAGSPPLFQLWSSFRPRHASPFVAPRARLSDYQIDVTISPDLSLSAQVAFHLAADASEGRTLLFQLSDRLQVESATVDGEPAEVFQRKSMQAQAANGGDFLLICPHPMSAGSQHTVAIRYGGSVIRKSEHGYFVDDRTDWYPVSGPTLTNFDLTFHCPEQLHVVSTGEVVSDQVANGIRTVHSKTEVPEPLAGFNLGDYVTATVKKDGYQIDCFSERSMASVLDPNLPSATADILKEYTQWWSPLPIHDLAVSPIDGYFGQGFPGLIYLSTVSYVRQEDRPKQVRGELFNSFFSDLLLPHEIAHQWWGNLVREANYRTAWLTEAMASDSAIEYLRNIKGDDAVDAVLRRYRDELCNQLNGQPLDSAGPIDFGPRLLDTAGFSAWHIITYEKGAWILQMLRARLGSEKFRKLQRLMLKEFANLPITNEDIRRLASQCVAPGDPDPSLSSFFDTWIYGTGLPKLALHRSNRHYDLEISNVDEDFTVDVPISCISQSGRRRTQWIRGIAGSNPVKLTPDTKSCELPPENSFLYIR